ncbi:DUF3157 family protein [Flavobacteriaceae bacterium XHP0103]|uniref:DUF3157 family protein n=1 Tax=Marixanthotalea marina TaxID=2844359 RepID=UPI002989E2E8|nr:DUF3157 family protein [Marixanthotalea marina]MBU3820804.1 DUF3157 family protein [Marixanthotalea marina]
MKNSLLILLLLISSIGFAQNNYIVKTEDGRRVLLKSDYTWEYIDLEKPAEEKAKPEKATQVIESSETNTCNLAADFEEPELDKGLQLQLRKGRATIDDIKRKVAKDNNCEEEDVILLAVSESKAKGIYNFCANGTKVSYKRTGHTIVKNHGFLQF